MDLRFHRTLDKQRHKSSGQRSLEWISLSVVCSLSSFLWLQTRRSNERQEEEDDDDDDEEEEEEGGEGQRGEKR